MDELNCCGNCIHWHELSKQRYKVRLGECKKIAEGTRFFCDGGSYSFHNVTFEDEVYDDEFGCFEEASDA